MVGQAAARDRAAAAEAETEAETEAAAEAETDRAPAPFVAAWSPPAAATGPWAGSGLAPGGGSGTLGTLGPSAPGGIPAPRRTAPRLRGKAVRASRSATERRRSVMAVCGVRSW